VSGYCVDAYKMVDGLGSRDVQCAVSCMWTRLCTRPQVVCFSDHVIEYAAMPVLLVRSIIVRGLRMRIIVIELWAGWYRRQECCIVLQSNRDGRLELMCAGAGQG
jgi:hypothetical protein